MDEFTLSLITHISIKNVWRKVGKIDIFVKAGKAETQEVLITVKLRAQGKAVTNQNHLSPFM